APSGRARRCLLPPARRPAQRKNERPPANRRGQERRSHPPSAPTPGEQYRPKPRVGASCLQIPRPSLTVTLRGLCCGCWGYVDRLEIHPLDLPFCVHVEERPV